MRRSLSKGRIALALCLSAGPPGHLGAQAIAADGAQNAGGLFLLFPVGARAVGMGQSAVTLEGSGDAVFWNPSGLATMENGEFALHSASLVAGATNALTAFFPRRGMGVFGGAVYLVDYGDQEFVDSTGTTIARLAPRNIELLASFATDLGGSFVFGLSYKLVEFRVDCSGDCTTVPAGLGVTLGVDVGYQRLLRLRGGYAFVHDGLGGPTVGLGVASGSIGVDLAHPFLTGSSLVTA